VLKAVEILDVIAKPLNDALGLGTTAGIVLALLLALGVVLATCFLLGSLVRTRIGSWTFDRIELVLREIPGYEIIGNLLKGFAEDRTAYRSVLVELYGPGHGVLGFVMDEAENGNLVVLVPSTPALTVGVMHFVTPDRVRYLDAGAKEVTDCISKWGVGGGSIVGG
jgi:uncharacterized membrane protein